MLRSRDCICKVRNAAHVLFATAWSREQVPAVKDAEKSLIAKVLKRSDGNQTIAARLLGMSRQALHNRLRRARKSTAE